MVKKLLPYFPEHDQIGEGKLHYQPKYDELYLKHLRNKAKKSWLGKIDPDNWLKEIRGGYDS